MKTLIAALLAAATVLLAGCSHTPPRLMQAPSYAGKQVANADAATADPGIVCTREIPTGLRMTVTRCRNLADVDQRRELDRSWAEKIPAELPRER